MSSELEKIESNSLLSKPIVAIVIICFLITAPLSVLFSFNQYLTTNLHISQAQAGFIIAAFNLVSLIIRPIITPFLSDFKMAKRILKISLLFSFAAFMMYPLSKTLFMLYLTRVIHGFGYVLGMSALSALMVFFIPKNRSGAAFSIFTTATLCPVIFIPPILPYLENVLGDNPNVICLIGSFLIIGVPLLLLIKEKDRVSDEQNSRVPLSEWLQNFIKSPPLIIISLTTMGFYLGYATVFYFLIDYSVLHKGNAGVFISTSMIISLLIRFSATFLLDKYSKSVLLSMALMVSVLGFLGLSYFTAPHYFLIISVLFGISWGFSPPLVSALIYDVSDDRFKISNVNMGLQMMDSGFLFGPLIGAQVLAHSSFTTLYILAALLTVTIAVLTLFVPKLRARSTVK